MSTPAGWYTDPTDPQAIRWWDGERWTEHLAPTNRSDSPADYATPLATEAEPASRSGLRLATGAAATLLVAVAGFFAFTQLTAASGGADTPEAAVEALLGAIADEDLVGVADVLLPGERRTFAEPLFATLDELIRLDVVSDSLDTESVSGVDFAFSNLVITSTPVADDLANVYASGTFAASLDGADLPVGSRVLELLGDDAHLDDIQEGPSLETFENLRLTTVRENGRWYVSILHTAAEAARLSAGVLPIPSSEGLRAQGAPSPEAAIDRFIEAVNDLSLGGMLALLNPDELAALQRYAPLFLDEAQRGIDSAGIDLTISDVAYSIDRRGDTALVTLESFALSVTFDDPYDGPIEVAMSFADGCISIEVPPEQQDQYLDPYGMSDGFPGFTNEDGVITSCADADLSALGIAPFPFEVDETGLVLQRVGGEWYLSPIATTTEAWLTVLRALDDDVIDDIATWFENMMGATMYEFEEYGTLVEIEPLDG